MKFLINSGNKMEGKVSIPGNKSGTARALILGCMAEGQTKIINPLHNIDSFSIIKMLELFGGKYDITNPNEWIVDGVGLNLKQPENVLDAENSGTGYYMITALAGTLGKASVVTGDYQVCYRPAGELVSAMNDLGAQAFSTRQNGLAPLVIDGKMTGGKTSLPSINSQWLTPLLISCSTIDNDSEIEVVGEPHEVPYINMTLGMMRQAGLEIEHDSYQKYFVKGGQKVKPTNFTIPGDWGTSGYPLVATAITGGKATFMNLNDKDYAGERAYVDILRKAGCKVEFIDGGITVESTGELYGQEIDCAGTPDAVPALAVLGCYSKTKTVLKNVGASRYKETDRTRIIKEELMKMGGKFEETEDTLTIYPSKLKGAFIDGHHDHRIVMASSIAALMADGVTIVDNAEYVGVSFPNFYETMVALGANIEKLDVIK